MRLPLLLLLSLVLMTFAALGIEASEPAKSTLNEREAAMQSRIDRLETQLNNARQTITELETELASARKAVAATSQAIAAPGSTADTQSATESSRIADANRGVPTSVTSLGPEELALGGVEDLSRLEFLVPGLRYGQTGHDVRLSMRGVSPGGRRRSPRCAR